MTNEAKKQRNSWLAVVGVLLAIILVLGIVLGVSVKRGKAEEPSKGDTPSQSTVAQAGGMLETEKQQNGIKLARAIIPVAEYAQYGISPTSAELAMTLTATITPEDAANKAVDWTVEFANAQSEWASGKTATNYVTATTQTDGALQAVVTCKGAFGEQILVKVTSRDDPSKSASCTFDYVKRITGADVSLVPVELKFSTQYSVSVTPKYSDGTLLGNYKETGYSLVLSQAMKDAIGGSYTYREAAVITPDIEGKTVSLGASAYTTFVQSGGNAEEFNNAFARAVRSVSLAHATFTVSYSYTYEESNYTGAAFVLDLKFDADSLTVGVTDITLSESHYYF